MTTEQLSPHAWPWWCAEHEEAGYSGPFETRDQAIAHGVANNYGLRGGECRFHICQAYQARQNIGDIIFVAEAVEAAHEGPWAEMLTEDSDDLTDHITPDQWADLDVRLKKAADEWHAAHGIVIKSWAFTDQRSEEWISAPARVVAS